jgi:hypothetical protein
MSEKRVILLPLIGSLFGLATGFIATYNILGSFLGDQEAPTSQLLIESGLWICWVGLQGIGFILIYMQNRQSIYAGTGVVGLLAMVLEIIAVYHIWNAIEDVAFALIGISIHHHWCCSNSLPSSWISASRTVESISKCFPLDTGSSATNYKRGIGTFYRID